MLGCLFLLFIDRLAPDLGVWTRSGGDLPGAAFGLVWLF